VAGGEESSWQIAIGQTEKLSTADWETAKTKKLETRRKRGIGGKKSYRRDRKTKPRQQNREDG
jgi:hypothetical protein